MYFPFLAMHKSRFNHRVLLSPCALRTCLFRVVFLLSGSWNGMLVSIIDRKPFLLTFIAIWESSAFIEDSIPEPPRASILNAQIEPSKIGVESMKDSEVLRMLNLFL